ncbi:GNAT family N-acetyltransferase [Enterococcus asini]|uniref:GNAT family N-acetyltransferase n=1 Tax=Enterococcus asini TaxID=57732 RepID=UPI00241C02F9|nr:GNAT family N-acetyltransferase [Enterococcus asini]
MPSYKNILALAVAKDYQHQGIGRTLLQGIEQWARTTGAAGVRLVSGEERIEVHEFYAACGYQRKKKQVNFRKEW